MAVPEIRQIKTNFEIYRENLIDIEFLHQKIKTILGYSQKITMMSKYLIIEESIEERTVFRNFAIIEAVSEEDAQNKYLEVCDINPEKIELYVFDLDEIEPDYFHYYEIDEDKML